MTHSPERFDHEYYRENGQDSDRIALWFYERVVRHFVPKGARVLDYGCGSGFFLRRLSGHFEAAGFDISPFSRELTQKNAPGALLFEDDNAIPSQAFDLITALHILEHVPDPSAQIRRFAGWLRPGGALLIVVPNPDGWGHKLKGSDWFAFRDPTHCSLLSSREWLDSVQAAGFQIRKAGTDGLWDAPYIKRGPRIAQLAIFGSLAALQVASGRLFLPAKWGECLVLLARSGSPEERVIEQQAESDGTPTTLGSPATPWSA